MMMKMAVTWSDDLPGWEKKETWKLEEISILQEKMTHMINTGNMSA